MKSRTPKWIYILFVFIMFGVSAIVALELNSFHFRSQIIAHRGQLNLTQAHMSKRDIIPLNGQWIFYPNQLLTPNDLSKRIPHYETYLTVPKVWGQGYGTYELDIHLTHEQSKLLNEIYVPSISSAYHLWINDQEVRSSGLTGKSRTSMSALDNPGLVTLHNNASNHYVMVIEVSNYVQQKGGIGEKFLLGNLTALSRFENLNTFVDLFITGALFIMSIYYFSYFLGHSRAKFPLYLSLLCADVAAQSFFLQSSNLMTLFPGLSWTWETKIQYLTVSGGAMLLILATHSLYPSESKRFISRCFLICGGLFSLFFILTPTWVFTYALSLLSLFTTLALCYMLYVFICAMKFGKDYARLNLLSLLFLLLAGINDILYYTNIIQTGNLVPEGLFAFLIMQTITFSHRHTQAINDLEVRTRELITVTEQLEERIHARTQELFCTLEELKTSNARLERLSMQDSLTLVPNRRYFEAKAFEMWDLLVQSKDFFTILFIDVDFFKQYNDTYGHIQGDICLQKIALALETYLQSYANAFIARLGGEEFAAVIPYLPPDMTSEISESLRQLILSLEIPHASSGFVPYLTISIGGITVAASLEDTVSELMVKADDALYQAKRDGRNRSLTLTR